MPENIFADKNYDDLSSLEAIFQASHNIVLVGLFRDSVPLILDKYHQGVTENHPAYDAGYQLKMNYATLHTLTWETLEEQIHAEPRYGAQLHNYKKFMVQSFYTSRAQQGKMDICDAFYQDIYLTYWNDERTPAPRVTPT